MADKEKRLKPKKPIKALSAFAVLFAIIGLMACLTWIIPSGEYKMIPDLNDSTSEIRKAGTYKYQKFRLKPTKKQVKSKLSKTTVRAFGTSSWPQSKACPNV